MTNERTVIVGAGMAGLTAAAYLLREGHNVLLLEKNDRIGGLLDTFEHEGFYFDAGPRAFVNSGMVKPILNDLGISWDFRENTISIGVENELIYVKSMEALDQYQHALNKLYPENQDDIEKIIELIRKLSDYTKVLYQFDNPNFVDLTKDKKFIFTELIPWTIKLLLTLRKFDRYKMPMEDALARLTGNQSLTDIMTQLFFRQTPTYFSLGYFYVYLDYFYPKGGTIMLPTLLHEKIMAGGGQIELNRKVVEVNPAKSEVIDADGNRYQYDHLVWAADLKTLYRITNTEGLESKTESAIASEAEKILSSKGAESNFMMFIGVDRPLSYFRERGGEHMFYTHYRQGLGETNRGDRQDLLDHFESKTKDEIMQWLDEYCRLNSYEVSVPGLRDPALTPDGQTGLMISCLFDYNIVKKIEEAGWHEEFKRRMEENIIRLFSKSIYPDLDQDVIFKFSSTPLTIQKIAGSSEGAIIGWTFEEEIPVENNLQDLPKSPVTSIPNVFKAGQWAYAPSGVPIAMLTGWHAAQKIIKGEKKKK
jgi:phytoene dehydrogenase-like protein